MPTSEALAPTALDAALLPRPFRVVATRAETADTTATPSTVPGTRPANAQPRPCQSDARPSWASVSTG